MSLLKELTELFQNIFMASSPDVKKRQALKRMELTLKDAHPVIYKSGMVQVSFAEALRVMFVNSKVIGEILSNTMCSEDQERNDHFIEQLILTGFSGDSQEILTSFTYENRKAGAMESSSLSRFFDKERRKLEVISKELNTPEFVMLDHVLDLLKQLNDICKYSYLTALRLFDVGYSTAAGYTPKFDCIPPDLMENSLLDLYYVTADMDITKSVGQAVLALDMLSRGGEMDLQRQELVLGNLRKMQGVLKYVFNNQNLISLIRLAKKTPDYEPQKALYKIAARQKFLRFLETKFTVDENRLKSEIQDENIYSQVKDLFGDRSLESVAGYNDELNRQLKASTEVSFQWVLPLQVLKSFAKFFFEENVKFLLNDIVIEGFFNNPTQKTEFSTIVFACNESYERIKAFEAKFNRSGEFDEAVITSLIRDSHRDKDFALKLKDMVERSNKEVHEIMQHETNNFHALSMLISEVLVDAKKPNSDRITNLKVLLMSSRNRDSSEALELQFPLWEIFIAIMRNYVVIGSSSEKK